ncbi:MAG: D-alanyl-D-alanine carboxypeptidase family protein [Candidatus Magasanikbacteria bacterium]|nr:D-alanyl-D-alanine carboxypeptidase family protein [Candidatus Magasanikbacteria bacterium]
MHRRLFTVALAVLATSVFLAPLPTQAGACACWDKYNGGIGTDCYYNIASPIGCEMILADKDGLKQRLQGRKAELIYCTYTAEENKCGSVGRFANGSLRFQFRDTEKYNVATIACGDTKELCTNINERCNIGDDCTRYGGGLSVGPQACHLGYCFLNNARYLRFQKQPTLFGIAADLQFQKPRFEVRIPGLKFSEAKDLLDKEGYLHIPYLGQFLTVIYRFGLAVGSIAAIAMLINNGLKITMSAGGEDKADGYRRIGQVVVGLMLLWGSYAILYNLNPELVRFRALKVKFIEPIPLPEEPDNIDPENFPVLPEVQRPTWKYDSFDCDQAQRGAIQPLGVVPDKFLARNYTCEGLDGTVTTVAEMQKPLCRAAKLAAEKGYRLRITSSHRSFQSQVDNWCVIGKLKYDDTKKAERKKFFAVPGFSNHGLGRAVDVKLIKDNQELFKIDSKGQCTVDPEIISTLAGFFYDADKNFVRLDTEIWHFEYGTAGQPTRSQTRSRSPTCKKPTA